ncbi:MAG: hypothetical protein VKL42_04185 [Snowella sp.]|nr:hypothetical protein [Snowella sp.]
MRYTKNLPISGSLGGQGLDREACWREVKRQRSPNLVGLIESQHKFLKIA